jgi:hypothetical protein
VIQKGNIDMADVTDVIIKMLDNQWSQAKQSEDQRSAVTNYVFVIAAAIQGYIVQRNFDKYSLAVAIFLIVLGIYGALISYKYYERFRLGMTRVGRWMEKLEELHPDANLAAIEKKADVKHNSRFPRMHRIRLYALWLCLHTAVSLAGVANAVVIYKKWS